MQRSSSPSVLIVRLDAIGDALVTVPLVAALRAAGMQVSAVLTERNAKSFARGALERVHIAAQPGAAAEIRAAGYDVALIPSEEPQAYALARDAGIPRRIGFWHGLRGKPFKSLWIRRQCTQVVYRGAGLDTGGRHECEVVFELGRPLLGDARPPRDAAQLRAIVIDEMPQPDPRIAFQVTDKWARLGASFEDVVALARAVSKDRELRFTAAANEMAFACEFATAANATVETFEELAPWKAAITASRAIVAPDSGAVHVAGMTGTPVIAVYAAENFARQVDRWRAWAAPYKTVAIASGWTAQVYVALQSLLSETAAV